MCIRDSMPDSAPALSWRFVKLNACLERVDGKADRSKTAAKISGEIKKTEMQSRRRRDLNAFQTRASFARFMRRSQLDRICRNFAKLCALCQAP